MDGVNLEFLCFFFADFFFGGGCPVPVPISDLRSWMVLWVVNTFQEKGMILIYSPTGPRDAIRGKIEV